MSLRIINNLAELEKVKTFWEKRQTNPNCDFEQFRLVCRSRKEVECPYVMALECEGDLCALLCSRLERISFTPRIGYLNPLKIPASVITVIHDGLVGEIDSTAARMMIEHLWSSLSRGEADAVIFSNLSEHSPLMAALMKHAPEWWCEKEPAWSTHRSMALGNEPGFLLKSMRSKHRGWIRKKQKDLESAFPGKVTWKWLNSVDDVADLSARLETLASRTYQRGLGAGFVDNDEHRRRFALFASRHNLRVQLLEIDGNVRAFWIGLVYQGIFHSWATGYDPDLREYEPGTLVLLQLVDELTREGVRTIDFGLGDAHYKERFGDASWREATLMLFAPSPKGFLLRSASGICAFMDHMGRRFLQKAGLTDRVKTGWRRRLADG